MYRQKNSYIVPLILLAGLYLIYLLIFKKGIMPALLFAALPAVVLGAIGVMRKNYIFFAYFILNYFISGISRYVPMKTGMIMFALSFGVLAVILVRNILEHQEWKRCRSFLLLAWGVWFIYCVLELLNPNAIADSWIIALPIYAYFPLFCIVVVSLMFTKYRNFQWLLIIWAGLTLIAAAKGYWQKNRGFDSAELTWLFSGGGRTHLINTGIRFFSFFTDAAAFGASMGMSLVVFGISGFYVSKLWIKALYWVAAVAAGYGLIISGTRSDLAIPFVGVLVYLILCRNFKAVVVSLFVLAGAFVFLNYTKIGDDNRLIHRMRTVFDKKDASWMVRVNNRSIIYKAMKGKPFGIGLGLAGRKAERFRPVDKYNPLTYIATDSWYMMMFIETGIVGLILYLVVLVSILLKASYIASFKIINRELRGQLIAIIGAISGILVTCYANEVMNYPNSIIVYTLMVFLFLAPYYDKELQQNESKS